MTLYIKLDCKDLKKCLIPCFSWQIKWCHFVPVRGLVLARNGPRGSSASSVAWPTPPNCRPADGRCSELAVRRAGTSVPCGPHPGSHAHVLCTTGAGMERPTGAVSLRRGSTGTTRRESCRWRRRRRRRGSTSAASLVSGSGTLVYCSSWCSAVL